MRTFAAGIVVLAVVSGCSREPSAPPKGGAPSAPLGGPRLADLPVEMTVRQRTTTPVPGSEEKLRLTVDDVTRGQVMVSLAQDEGGIVLAPVSLGEGASARFLYGGTPYQIVVTRLKNAVMGTDFATVEFRAGEPKAQTEAARIEALIAAVSGLKGGTFLRNGAEHDPAEAAEHLRVKWQAAGDDVVTARQFIDQIASRSSLSGQPYEIRLPGGEVVRAQAWLYDRLAEIERR